MPSIFTTNRESSISIMPFSRELSSWMKQVLKARRSKTEVLKALVPQEKGKKKIGEKKMNEVIKTIKNYAAHKSHHLHLD